MGLRGPASTFSKTLGARLCDAVANGASLNAACVFDGVARFVGSLEECERRAAILLPKSDRAAQDKALARVTR